MKKSLKIHYAISISLLVLGILWAIFASNYCYRSNENYTEIQPESFVPDMIDRVLYDEELKQLYVCYASANCVNVYSEAGDFLWAVGVPSIMRGTYYFELQDDKLIIYDTEAYIYNSKSGEFLGLEDAEKLDLPYNWQDELTDTPQKNQFYHQAYDVYKTDSDGNLHTIVSRPWWHRLFDSGIGGIVAFIGAAGFGAVILSQRAIHYREVKKKVVIKNPKILKSKKYTVITTIIHFAYTVLNIIFGFFGGILCIGIIPIAIHFVVASVIQERMLKKVSVRRAENDILAFWSSLELISFIIAFLSVIAVATIMG